MAADNSVKLEGIKSQVRSLLVSYPGKTMELNRFLKDFDETIGKPLPFREYNFSTPLQFLSSLNDVVQVKDTVGGGVQLSPVISELSGHISNLVDNQKKSKHAPPKSHRSRHQSRPPPNQKGVGNFRVPPPLLYPVMPFPQQHPRNVGMPANWQMPLYGIHQLTGKPQLNYHCNDNNNFRAHSAQPYFHLGNQSKLSNSKHVPTSTVKNTASLENKITSIPTEKRSVFCPDQSSSVRVNSNFRNCEDTKGDLDGPNTVQEANNQLSEKKANFSRGVGKYSLSSLSSHSLQLANQSSPTVNLLNNEKKPISCSQNLDFKTLEKAISDISSNGSTTVSNQKSKQEGLNDIVKTNIWSVLEVHSNGVSLANFLNLYNATHSQPLNFEAFGYSSLKEMVLKNEDVFSFEKTKQSDDWIIYDARVKPRRRQSVDPSNNWIPHYVADNLAALARRFPGGIEADKVLAAYKERFGTEINPEILGFSSLDSFLGNCRSIQYQITNDKGVVYPTTWALKCGSTESVPRAKLSMEELRCIWKDHFKENECDPSFEYKPPVIPDEKVVQVKLVDVSSPALFWIQFLEDAKALNTMMFLLNSFYDIEEANYELPDHLILPGLAVASLFMNKWHRAVVKMVTGKQIDVVYVDYGTTSSTKLENIRKLDKRFSEERIYCVKASFFCLIPYEGDEWSFKACNYLFNEWGDQIVYAELCSVDYLEPAVAVNLYHTSENIEVDVGELLVKNKLAKYMVNPDLIINEAAASKFLKFLPRWFSCSKTTHNDVQTCLKNLIVCSSSNCEPIDNDVVPCCKVHCIQKFFLAKPEVVGVLWQNACELEEERILNRMLYQVKDTLIEWGWWDSCGESQMFCSGRPSQPPLNSTTAPYLKNTINPKIQSTNHEDSNVKINELNEHLRNVLANHKGNRTYTESHNESVFGSYKTSSVFQSTAYNDYPLVDGQNAAPFTPRVVRYMNACVQASILTLLFFKEEFRLCLDQLIGITAVPRKLAHHRLSSVQAEFYCVVREHNADAYDDLRDLGLIVADEEPKLVLCKDAPSVIQVIDPVGDYSEIIKTLLLTAYRGVDKMIGPKTQQPH